MAAPIRRQAIFAWPDRHLGKVTSAGMLTRPGRAGRRRDDAPQRESRGETGRHPEISLPMRCVEKPTQFLTPEHTTEESALTALAQGSTEKEPAS